MTIMGGVTDSGEAGVYGYFLIRLPKNLSERLLPPEVIRLFETGAKINQQGEGLISMASFLLLHMRRSGSYSYKTSKSLEALQDL